LTAAFILAAALSELGEYRAAKVREQTLLQPDDAQGSSQVSCACPREPRWEPHGRRPSGSPDSYEQRPRTRPRSRTNLNESGCPHRELRIRRSGACGWKCGCPPPNPP
jgi:hypothetical protein